MKVTKSNSSPEKEILTAMIVNDDVCGKLALKWSKEGLFRSNWCNVVGKWCVTYHNKYGKAPRKNIESLFKEWTNSKSQSPESVQLVHKLLSSLAGRYSRTNKDVEPEYVVDLAANYVNEVHLERLLEKVQENKDQGKWTEAWEGLLKANKLEVKSNQGIDLLLDKSMMKRTVRSRETAALIRYPGAAGKFFGSSLERSGFIAFLGPEKRGKSQWLLDVAWRGMSQRNKVAFFEAGDLSECQAASRFYSRAMNRPMKSTREGRPILYPTKFERPDDDKFQIEREERVYTKSATEKEIRKACQQFMERRLKSDESFLKLSSHPNSSLSVNGMRAVIKEWGQSGWKPDVIVVDYADILAAPPGNNHSDSRDSINENWKSLRRLSQELDCLVVTATQANAASYTAESLRMSNFSEDKRKFAHVTGMIGINQSDDEKKSGVQRLNWLVLREEEFIASEFVYVAGCLAVSNPCVLSA